MPETTSLVQKIRDGYFKDWSDERKDLEEIWSLSYDAFRGDYSTSNLPKWKKLEGHEWRSKIFVRLTKMKVVSAVAQIEDVYFQGGKIPYNLSPSPVPEGENGIFLDPGEARVRCEKMKTRIDDILVESEFMNSMIHAILEMAVYGMSWLKAPVIRPRTKLTYRMKVPMMAQLADMVIGTNLAQKYGRHVMVPQTSFEPTIEHPNIWDMFWDMEADNPQDGQGLIHRVWMTPGMLARKLEVRGYDTEAIKRVIAKQEDSGTRSPDQSEGPARERRQGLKRTIKVLEYLGKIPMKYLEGTEMGMEKKDEKGRDYREKEIFTVIADDEIIYPPKLSPYPAELRNLHTAYWETLPHETQGIGIPENIRDAQMMINSATRCYIDNKAISGNILSAFKPGALAPGQNKGVYPGKSFELSETVKDVREAIMFFSPTDVGEGLLQMINLFERFADEESNLPKLLEGEKSVGDPKTAYAFSRLVENANKALGKVIRNIDAGHTSPVVKGIYHWEMANNPDESLKGDYCPTATGFSSYVDKVVRGQELQNFLMFLLSNSILSLYPKIGGFVEEITKAKGFDVSKLLFKEEEVAQRAALMQNILQPPPQLGEGGIPIEQARGAGERPPEPPTPGGPV